VSAKNEKIKSFIIDRLRNELDKKLIYHNLEHTLDVMVQAGNIARAEGIEPGHMTELLQIAAAFHDSGFLYTYKNHEEKSCELFKSIVEGKMEQNDIDLVCGMIMATRIPQSPKTLYEQIICDADLDYLGRNDFEPISKNLYKEFIDFGILKKEDDWNRIQVGFFEMHKYFTESSKEKRNSKKQENLLTVKAVISGPA